MSHTSPFLSKEDVSLSGKMWPLVIRVPPVITHSRVSCRLRMPRALRAKNQSRSERLRSFWSAPRKQDCVVSAGVKRARALGTRLVKNEPELYVTNVAVK